MFGFMYSPSESNILTFSEIRLGSKKFVHLRDMHFIYMEVFGYVDLY